MGGKSSSSQYQESTSILDSYNKVLTQNLADVGNVKINIPEMGQSNDLTKWLVPAAVAALAFAMFRK